MDLLILIPLLFVASVCGEEHEVSHENENLVPDYSPGNIQELLKWESPEQLQKDFPYFLSGYDDEGAPIWILEFGHWDMRKVVDEGPKAEAELRKHIQQFLARVVASIPEKSTTDHPVTEFNAIIDLEGYGSRQATSPKTLGVTLWLARQMHLAWFGKLKYGFLINCNYLFTTVYELMKPLLGPNTYKIQVFGTTKDKWLPRIIKTLPKSEIPSWVGGNADHKPIKIYG